MLLKESTSFESLPSGLIENAEKKGSGQVMDVVRDQDKGGGQKQFGSMSCRWGKKVKEGWWVPIEYHPRLMMVVMDQVIEETPPLRPWWSEALW
jgi:hypothetical protein